MVDSPFKSVDFVLGLGMSREMGIQGSPKTAKGLTAGHFLNDADDVFESYMPRIGVMGIGGAGTNAVNLLKSELGEQVDFFVCNTDVQSLRSSICENRIILGPKITRGKGAGAKPELGRASAEDSIEEVLNTVKSKAVDMLIITGGEGGGTATGAMPVIAAAARAEGILTIGVVTKPFHSEGEHRRAIAEQGIQELQREVDALVVIANERLTSLTNAQISFKRALEITDKFVCDCVRSFVSIVKDTGLINVDYADLCAVAKDKKTRALMGTGYAEGENCGAKAIDEAMSNFLLDFDGISWDSVCNVAIAIHGGEDLPMSDVVDINDTLRKAISPNANIITGTTIRPEMKGAVQVFVFGTGPAHNSKTTQAEFKKSKPSMLEYNESEYIGTRHDLHEDVKPYKIATQEPPKAQESKRRGFLSRFIPGYQDHYTDEELNVVEKNFIPDFLSGDENKKKDE